MEKVILIPSYKHPFKGDTAVLDYDTRLSLAQDAVRQYNSNNGMMQTTDECISQIEVWDSERGASGYTSDLLRKLLNANPHHCYSFVIGADNLVDLHKWHDFEWLCSNVHFIIIPRADFPIHNVYLDCIMHSVLDIPLCNISSTEIRDRIRTNLPVSDMLPISIEGRVIEQIGRAHV